MRASWNDFGALLGPSWGRCVRFWNLLGALPGPPWGPWGPSRGHPGSNLSKQEAGSTALPPPGPSKIALWGPNGGAPVARLSAHGDVLEPPWAPDGVRLGNSRATLEPPKPIGSKSARRRFKHEKMQCDFNILGNFLRRPWEAPRSLGAAL